jgi:hypothetical protein
MPLQPTARPGENCVTIISDEPPRQLARLCSELEHRGIESVIQQAATSARRVGIGYIRNVDPSLVSGSSFVRVATLGMRPAFVVNNAGSVRIAEWAPLACHALRDSGVPQPSRLWCLDERDIKRVSEILGTPIVFEGLVTRRRFVARAPNELESAFAEAVGSHPCRGAMAEAPIPDPAAHVAIMVIDGVCIPLRGRQAHGLSPLAGKRAALAAGQAVAALGGSAMAVEVTIDQNDEASVTRVDPAPRIDRLNSEAIAALVGAIAARLAAFWPSSYPPPRAASASPTPFARVGHPC